MVKASKIGDVVFPCVCLANSAIVRLVGLLRLPRELGAEGVFVGPVVPWVPGVGGEINVRLWIASPRLGNGFRTFEVGESGMD